MQTGRYLKSLFSQFDGRIEQPPPRKLAVILVRGFKHPEQSRDAD